MRFRFCAFIVLCFSFSTISVARKKSKKAKSVTEIDFEGSLLEGKMKAPSGFFLRGRKAQSLQSIIKLRSNFRGRIQKSRKSVESIVK
ncbi:MAG: hypothetical protein AB8C84_02545 [Oligoflexales bacterium]